MNQEVTGNANGGIDSPDAEDCVDKQDKELYFILVATENIR